MSPDPPSSSTYRIGYGGLLRRFENASRLTRVPAQLAAVFLLAWVPLMVLSLVHEHLTGHREVLRHDALMHVRLLVAIPTFLIIDGSFPKECGYALTLLVSQRFVPVSEQVRLERAFTKAARMADSSVPEVMLAFVSVALGAAALGGAISVQGIEANRLTPAQVWYALSGVPLFEFLLWRSLWRWVIWVRLLAGISRITLALVPTHPDKRGGIRFLRFPSLGYCALLLFAISSVLCAGWGGGFTVGATIASFVPLLIIFATAGTFLAFGPLLPFTFQLFRARRAGLAELGDVAANCGRRFQRRYADDPSEYDPVAIQTLSSVEQTYREAVNQLNLLLVDKRDLAFLLVATLLPVVPVMLSQVPLEDWRDLLQAVTGLKR